MKGVNVFNFVCIITWILHPCILNALRNKKEINENSNYLDIEKDKRRISLDYKSTQPNPWDKIKEKVGSTVKFKINNITDKALFGELIDFKNEKN